MKSELMSTDRKVTQFTVKLRQHDGERSNYFNYGSFENQIAAGARLVHLIEMGSGDCILVFEKDAPYEIR